MKGFKYLLTYVVRIYRYCITGIIINQFIHVGISLTIYPCVEIGHKEPRGKYPIIGNNCFVGIGAKIFGDIHVGDNVTIVEELVILKNMVIGGLLGSTIIVLEYSKYNLLSYENSKWQSVL